MMFYLFIVILFICAWSLFLSIFNGNNKGFFDVVVRFIAYVLLFPIAFIWSIIVAVCHLFYTFYDEMRFFLEDPDYWIICRIKKR